MLENGILSQSDLLQAAGGIYSGPCIQYTVVKGDNLSKIARKYGASMEVLTQINHIRGNKIYIGQVLLIPALTV